MLVVCILRFYHINYCHIAYNVCAIQVNLVLNPSGGGKTESPSIVIIKCFCH